MNVTTTRSGIITAILDIFQSVCAEFYTKLAPFVNNIVSLGLTCHQDALSLIWVLNKEGRLSVGQLAKELGIRKVDGVWRAFDPLLSTSTLSLTQLEQQGFDVADERGVCEEEDHQQELPQGVIACTATLAQKFHIGRRRAQQIVAEQIADFKTGNNLFGLGI
jgi:hypothetical protein